MSDVKISVILPSLNVANYIRKSIESVMRQTMQEIEILCIDAGSTDGTLEIINELAKTDPRIRVIQSDRKSYGYQVNMGIRLARGKYIDIVETDDYIRPGMLEDLYRQAEEYQLDFIKADFICMTIVKGRSFFRKISNLEEEYLYLYHQIINPQDHPELQAQCHNIWNGIYRRTLLLSKNILLNESKGAAFQDIAFHHLLYARAERMMYVPEQYYVYLENRDSNSMSSSKGLSYCRNEYEHLFDVLTKGELVHNKRYIMRKIVRTSLFFEINKVLRIKHYHIDENDVVKPIAWFGEVVRKAEEDGSLHLEDFTEGEQNNLKMILESIDQYASDLEESDQKKRRKILEDKKNLEGTGKPLILFGAGRRGTEFLIQAFTEDIAIAAITDNAEKLWGKQIEQIPILSPKEIRERYPDAIYIIANKNAGSSIYQQLLQMGCREKQIFQYIPEDGIQDTRIDYKNSKA